jgi:UPF0716 protein FxsA
MPLLLVLVFIVVPIAELYVIIKVGEAIGAVPTIAILIADSIVGSMLLRHQGRGAWRRFNEALREGRQPAREVLDGALVIFGGAFLITPGFLTDIIGIVLLLPPTRAAVRRVLVGYFSRRFVVSTARRAAGRGGRPPQPDAQAAHDVEGTAVDVDPPALDR